MRKVVIATLLLAPLTAFAWGGGSSCSSCCDKCWQFGQRDEARQSALILMQRERSLRAASGAQANASVSVSGVYGAGDSLANSQAIGNQNVIIIDGDGNVVNLNSTQTNQNSNQSASNDLDGNTINNEFLNIEGDYSETNNTTNTTNTTKNVDVDVYVEKWQGYGGVK